MPFNANNTVPTVLEDPVTGQQYTFDGVNWVPANPPAPATTVTGNAFNPGNVIIAGGGGGGAGGNIPIPNGNANGTIWITAMPSGGNYSIQGQQAQQLTLTWPGQPQDELPVEVKKEKSEGCTCKKCNEFNAYAEANQPDDTFICYGCRVTW